MEGFFVLGFFLIVVGIPVAGGIAYSAFERWLKHKEKMSARIAGETAEKAAQYAAHTERLEQRVRVLELWQVRSAPHCAVMSGGHGDLPNVTDKGIDVADEIERLRDRPLN